MSKRTRRNSSTSKQSRSQRPSRGQGQGARRDEEPVLLLTRRKTSSSDMTNASVDLAWEAHDFGEETHEPMPAVLPGEPVIEGGTGPGDTLRMYAPPTEIFERHTPLVPAPVAAEVAPSWPAPAAAPAPDLGFGLEFEWEQAARDLERSAFRYPTPISVRTVAPPLERADDPLRRTPIALAALVPPVIPEPARVVPAPPSSSFAPTNRIVPTPPPPRAASSSESALLPVSSDTMRALHDDLDEARLSWMPGSPAALRARQRWTQGFAAAFLGVCVALLVVPFARAHRAVNAAASPPVPMAAAPILALAAMKAPPHTVLQPLPPPEPVPAAPRASATPEPVTAPASAAPAPSVKELVKDATHALNQGKTTLAIELATRAVEADETEGKAYVVWGTALLERGRRAEAKEIFERCADRATRGPREVCKRLR